MPKKPITPKPKFVREFYHLNRHQSATLMGITAKTLDEWNQPRVRQGRETFYDARSLVSFRLRQLTQRTRLSLQDEQAKLAEARRKKIDLDLERSKGELIEREQVKDEFFKMGRVLRDSMLAIPDRLSSLLAAEQQEQVIHHALTEEITRALTSLKPPSLE